MLQLCIDDRCIKTGGRPSRNAPFNPANTGCVTTCPDIEHEVLSLIKGVFCYGSHI